MSQSVIDKPARQLRQLYSNISLNLLLRGFAVLSAFLMHLMIARLLGAHGSGLVYLAWSILFVAAVIGKQGMDVAVIRHAGSAWDRQQFDTLYALLDTAHSRCLRWSLGTATLLVILAYPLSHYVFKQADLLWVLVIVSLTVIPYSHYWVSAGFLKAISRSQHGTIAESLLVPVCMLIFMGLLFVSGWLTAQTLSVAFLLSCVVNMWLANGRIRQVMPVRSGRACFSEPLQASAQPLMMLDGLNWLIAFSAIPILGLFATAEQVAHYSIAQKLTMQISLVLMVCNSVIAPRFAGLFESSQHQALYDLYRKTTRLITLVALPLALLFIFWPGIVSLLFGQGFAEAEILLPILALAQLLNVATGPAGYVLTSTGHEKRVRNIMLANTLIIIPLVIVCSWQWQALGAAVATATGLAIQNLSACYFAYKKVFLPAKHIPFSIAADRLQSRVS